MGFSKVLNYAQFLVAERVNPGDVVVDATCGNGNDTVFLAKLVGDKGRVYAFDIQERAIINTKNSLLKNNLLNNVELINDSHENIINWIKTPITAAMFNLGYLPKSDKLITTEPNKTIKAIDSLLKLIKVDGIITIIVYKGHDYGNEAKIIEGYLEEINQKNFQILKYNFINQINNPPYLIAITKL